MVETGLKWQPLFQFRVVQECGVQTVCWMKNQIRKVIRVVELSMVYINKSQNHFWLKHGTCTFETQHVKGVCGLTS